MRFQAHLQGRGGDFPIRFSQLRSAGMYVTCVTRGQTRQRLALRNRNERALRGEVVDGCAQDDKRDDMRVGGDRR